MSPQNEQPSEVMDIQEEINNLKDSIEAYKLAKEDMRKREETFREENSAAYESLKHSAEKITEMEEIIRTAALKKYTETLDKKYYNGVSVILRTKIDYNKDTALTWAKEHQMCLSLNTKEFESVAKTCEIDFVTINDIPSAIIARK